ncbi:hypothetical protein Tco_1484846 [Tanacetum coccineum]
MFAITVGIEFEEIFAPVGSASGGCQDVFVAYAATQVLSNFIYMDEKTTFSLMSIERSFYYQTRQIPLDPDHPDKVTDLRKTRIMELKQAPRAYSRHGRCLILSQKPSEEYKSLGDKLVSLDVKKQD